MKRFRDHRSSFFPKTTAPPEVAVGRRTSGDFAMNKSFRMMLTLMVATTPWLVAPVIAAPLTSPLMLKSAAVPSVETVQYRRGYGYGYGGAAVGLGIAGALIGGAIIGATQPYGYYGYPSGYYGYPPGYYGQAY